MRQQWADELNTCIQLIATLLTNVTTQIKQQVKPVRFTCLGDLPIFCARLFFEIADVFRSIEGTELQTLTKSVRDAQNLLLLLLSSDNLKIETAKMDLVHVEQGMILYHPNTFNN